MKPGMDHQAPWSNLHSTTNCSSCHARWSPVVKFWLSWTESHSFPNQNPKQCWPILCMVIKNKQMFEIYPSNCVSKSQQCLFIRKLCISDRYGSDAIRFLEIFCCVEKILVNSKWFQPLEAQTYSLTSATHKFCEFLGSNLARNHSYHTHLHNVAAFSQFWIRNTKERNRILDVLMDAAFVWNGLSVLNDFLSNSTAKSLNFPKKLISEVESPPLIPEEQGSSKKHGSKWTTWIHDHEDVKASDVEKWRIAKYISATLIYQWTQFGFHFGRPAYRHPENQSKSDGAFWEDYEQEMIWYDAVFYINYSNSATRN